MKNYEQMNNLEKFLLVYGADRNPGDNCMYVSKSILREIGETLGLQKNNGSYYGWYQGIQIRERPDFEYAYNEDTALSLKVFDWDTEVDKARLGAK